MRVSARRPSVAAMNDSHLLRVAGGAAVAGATAQFLASLLEPDWGGEPGKAVRVVADNSFWNGDRLLDLIGVFLTVGALTVVGRTFAERSGCEWARVGQPFLVLMAALGASAVATGATMKVLAQRWADAAPQLKQSYLAAFDAASRLTEVLFFAAFMALALYASTPAGSAGQRRRAPSLSSQATSSTSASTQPSWPCSPATSFSSECWSR